MNKKEAFLFIILILSVAVNLLIYTKNINITSACLSALVLILTNKYDHS